MFFLKIIIITIIIGNLDGSSILLASSAKDRSVCIWDIKSGRCEKRVTLPAPTRQLSDPQKKRLNMTLAWLPRRRQLIVSTYK